MSLTKAARIQAESTAGRTDALVGKFESDALRPSR
jgi:hypothetical protein